MSIVADLDGKRGHQRPVVEKRMAPGIDRNCVATLAHEIRNILSPLSGSLELLNMAGIDEMSASRARGVIGHQVRQLQRLVNDLLDAHRIEYEQIQIIPSLTELSTALEAICEDHRPVFASRGITLALDVMSRADWVASVGLIARHAESRRQRTQDEPSCVTTASIANLRRSARPT